METVTKHFIQELGLEHLPESKQKDILNQLGIIIGKGVVAKSIEFLHEEDIAMCNTMIGQDASLFTIIEFLKEKVPDFENIVQEELELVRKTLTL